MKKNITLKGIPNGTKIDAQKKGRCIKADNNLKIIDIVVQNGYSTEQGGGIYASILELSGNCVVQNCYAKGYTIPFVIWNNGGGGISGNRITLRGNSKIINNSSDGWGGGIVGTVYAYDSVEISNNNSQGRGGGIWGYLYSRGGVVNLSFNKAKLSGGGIYGIDSGSASLCYNIAEKSGGGVQGEFTIVNAKIIGNHAPKGAAVCTDTFSIVSSITKSYIYNIDSFGKRQNEIHSMKDSRIFTDQCWFGQGFSIPSLISQEIGSLVSLNSYVIPNWRLNRGRSIGKTDTLFLYKLHLSTILVQHWWLVACLGW